MKTLLIGISALLAVSATPLQSSAQEVSPQPVAGQELNGEVQYGDPDQVQAQAQDQNHFDHYHSRSDLVDDQTD